MVSNVGADTNDLFFSVTKYVTIHFMVEPFTRMMPPKESWRRTIVLMGRRVATYQFAIAASLTESSPTGADFAPI